MERLAAKMGGTTKFPYNDSECLDADFFKVSFWLFSSIPSQAWFHLNLGILIFFIQGMVIDALTWNYYTPKKLAYTLLEISNFFTK